ncbi:MAG: outer membrane protein OmpA-like peptidoglycan-associated protein [Polyangiales bacterium]|jgi:outer membrane protein OmpA-like peptidoglycan-associated protein
MRLREVGIFIAIVMGVTLLAPEPAQADSGRFHLHLDLGLGVPVTGPTSRRSTHNSDRPLGGVGWLSADYQLAPPVAIELIVGFGGFGRPFEDSRTTGATFTHLGIGARFRFADDLAGYNNEPNGNLLSNLWVSAHVGFMSYDKSQFGVDAAIGYELSIVRPFQLGVFARTAIMFGGRDDSTDMIVVAGLTLGLELIRTRGATDSDGDGLSDTREEEIGTDPYDDDTDGDLISDGVEDATGTNPKERDTDNDGLNDGIEDSNQNGTLDAGETDPRLGDTDGGGMSDPDEVRTVGQDPQYAEDDDSDSDGVANNFDSCPGTPAETEVNGVGCPPAPEAFTLEGVRFQSNRANILDESESTLLEALETLRRMPEDSRFEIVGHTDDQGESGANQRLSRERAEAILRWLIEHGLDRGRFEVRGFGEEQPIDTNDTDEGRAHNRRIEFRRL